MTLTLEEAQSAMFNRFEQFLCDLNTVVELDPDLDATQCSNGAWLRSDGTSIGFEQTKPNELMFRLQVPMDTLLVVKDKVESGEIDIDVLLGLRSEVEEETGA